MGKVNFVIRRELDEEKIFCKPEICKACRGEGCCKNCGCAFSPNDFYVFNYQFSDEQRYQYLKHFLKKGYASIDHKLLNNQKTGAFIAYHGLIRVSFEKILNNEGALYIRMRNKGKDIVDVLHIDPYEETLGCIGLTEKGCRFSFKKRPKGGRMIIPDISGLMDCNVIYSEYHAAIDWYPYQEILYRLYLEFME